MIPRRCGKRQGNTMLETLGYIVSFVPHPELLLPCTRTRSSSFSQSGAAIEKFRVPCNVPCTNYVLYAYCGLTVARGQWPAVTGKYWLAVANTRVRARDRTASHSVATGRRAATVSGC